eukprot:4977689-Heterocapsa_arctica.AAC.1
MPDMETIRGLGSFERKQLGHLSQLTNGQGSQHRNIDEDWPIEYNRSCSTSTALVSVCPKIAPEFLLPFEQYFWRGRQPSIFGGVHRWDPLSRLPAEL